jgi:SAM-dependent methyltransferase
MMFGSREAFRYILCAACGCLQIGEIPPDMARHYPEGYYSFSGAAAPDAPRWKRALRSLAARQRLQGAGLAGRLASRIVSVPSWIDGWFRPAGIRMDSRILEAGCGKGHLLRQMAGYGFRSLTGVDPFVDSDLDYPDGVRILRRRLEDVSGSYDLVMMHHAFEHMPDAQGTLREVRRLLVPGGRALIRIPIAEEAWRLYGTDWVQLDPPRHFYLHTRRSMEILAAGSGFSVERVDFDSTGFQFWGSEQYLKGIPLFSPGSHAVDPGRGVFPEESLRRWEERARELNRLGLGDQACFFLEPA